MVSIWQVTTGTYVLFLVQGRKRDAGTGMEHHKIYEWNHPALGVHHLVFYICKGRLVVKRKRSFSQRKSASLAESLILTKMFPWSGGNQLVC